MRPREQHVPQRTDDCPEHGTTTFRQHKVGLTPKGEQKYRWRCMECHAARQKGKP